MNSYKNSIKILPFSGAASVVSFCFRRVGCAWKIKQKKGSRRNEAEDRKQKKGSRRNEVEERKQKKGSRRNEAEDRKQKKGSMKEGSMKKDV